MLLATPRGITSEEVARAAGVAHISTAPLPATARHIKSCLPARARARRATCRPCPHDHYSAVPSMPITWPSGFTSVRCLPPRGQRPQAGAAPRSHGRTPHRPARSPLCQGSIARSPGMFALRGVAAGSVSSQACEHPCRHYTTSVTAQGPAGFVRISASRNVTAKARFCPTATASTVLYQPLPASLSSATAPAVSDKMYVSPAPSVAAEVNYRARRRQYEQRAVVPVR